MQDMIDLLVNYAREIRQRQWLILLASTLLCIFGWYAVWNVPDKYEANAKVYIDTQSILRPLLSGLTVYANTNQQVALLVKTLLSKPNVERLIQMSDLDLDSVSERKALVEKLQNEIELEREKRHNIFTIKYLSPDKKSAKRLVDSVLTLFMENSVGENREDTLSAKRFIDQQLKEYEDRLRSSENALKEFKKKNLGMMPSDGIDYYQRLQAASRKSDEAKLVMKELISERNSVEDQLAGIEETSLKIPEQVYVSNSLSTSYDARVSRLEESLDEFLLKYTTQHPDVKNMSEQLARLKKMQKRERSEIQKSLAGNSVLSTSVGQGVDLYNHLKLTLSDLNTKIASMEIRLGAYSDDENELKILVDTIPDIEVQLGELNRGYGVTRSRYNELLTRRESIEISRKASQNTDDIQFKIIEPPSVSNTPVWPNRTILVSFVFPASLGLSAALSLCLILINPRVMSAKHAAELTGFPVIGHVSKVESKEEKRKVKFNQLIYLILFGSLFVANLFVIFYQ